MFPIYLSANVRLVRNVVSVLSLMTVLFSLSLLAAH